MEPTISRSKILAALRMAIISPEHDNPLWELWQMAQSNLAANLYGRIVLGEFDVEAEQAPVIIS
jgi:hypothetical protein